MVNATDTAKAGETKLFTPAERPTGKRLFTPTRETSLVFQRLIERSHKI